MSALQLENICKSFDLVEVLKGINLTVEEGEFVVFVGPSGCGKSTLLRVIAGIEDATSGTVKIDGDVVNDIPPAKRGIAMVFQSYALYPHLTVRANMTLALKQAKERKSLIEERVAKASKMLSMEEYLERHPAELSGGQRQRVAIGRAIVREPKLFLFDEPLSNLDAALRMNTRLEIANLHRSLGTSMVYVTHDQTEAMTLADKIVVLHAGEVEQIGSPMELYNNPVNQFVARFLGLPSMNFIDAAPFGRDGAKMLGIRPEHLRLGKGQLSGDVIHVEWLGADTNVMVTLASGEGITVRLLGQHPVEVGSTVEVEFNMRDAFYFDSEGVRV